MLLGPPPQRRSRASSTGVRPPLSILSLQRRRSSFSLDDRASADSDSSYPPSVLDSSPSPSPTSSTPPHSLSPKYSRAHLFKMVNDLLVQFRIRKSEDSSVYYVSESSSPRSSSESEYILPLSASHTKTTFDVQLVPSSNNNQRHSTVVLITSILILFCVSTGLVLLSLTTLPITFSWPHTLTDLADLGRQLGAYSSSGLLPFLHVLAVLSLSAIWKHAWSIPGSVLWNVLAGALFHPLLATLLLTTLTTIGSVLSTLLTAPLAPVLTRFFPRPLELTKIALEGTSSTRVDLENEVATENKNNTPTWVRLSILRLVGIVPWSGLNVACGLVGVSLADCALGAFIGTLPWTAVTCHVGDILQTFVSVQISDVSSGPAPQTLSSVLASPKVIFELVVFSVLSIAPILARQRLAKLVGLGSESKSATIAVTAQTTDEDGVTRIEAVVGDLLVDKEMNADLELEETIQQIANDASGFGFADILKIRSGWRPLRWSKYFGRWSSEA